MVYERGAEVRDGHLVSQRVSQVIDAIKEYSPELDVEWIPPLARKPGQAAFRIVHKPIGGEPYIIFHVKTEEEMNTSILQRLIAGDQRNGAAKYSDLEAAEEAAKRVAQKRWEDERDETIDKMYHVLKSPLNKYTLDKNTIIRDGIPFNAKGY